MKQETKDKTGIIMFVLTAFLCIAYMFYVLLMLDVFAGIYFILLLIWVGIMGYFLFSGE